WQLACQPSQHRLEHLRHRGITHGLRSCVTLPSASDHLGPTTLPTGGLSFERLGTGYLVRLTLEHAFGSLDPLPRNIFLRERYAERPPARDRRHPCPLRRPGPGPGDPAARRPALANGAERCRPPERDRRTAAGPGERASGPAGLRQAQ